MAKMIPPVEIEQILHEPEQVVYKALAQLPDSYVVMHSYPWLRPNRDLESQPLNEGEADFIVLHPKFGLLIVEVKGGTPELINRIWYRQDKQIRDPFQQARRNKYALIDSIEERSNRQLHRGLFNYGEVVIFPHCTYEGRLPLDVDPRILIDSYMLKNIEANIENAYLAWQKKLTTLTKTEFDELVKLLLPKLRLLRCIGSDIASDEARIMQITKEQQTTLQGLLANKRVLVEGVAGSGKTLLALDFAVTLALQGKKTLLLCFNKQLAIWLKEQIIKENRLSEKPNLLDINYFHSFALNIAKKAKVEFEIPDKDTDTFWDQEVPLILEQSIEILTEQLKYPLYDAIIIDEGQDFLRDWWVTVESLLSDKHNGQLYVFIDLNQNLRGEKKLPPILFSAKFALQTNCRNTRAIANTASNINSTKIVCLPSIPEGEPPSLHRVSSSKMLASLVVEEINKLIKTQIQPKQIAIIGPASFEKGSLAKFSNINGVKLIIDPAKWRQNEGILVTTARTFKGLEADIVFLYDLSSFSNTFTKTDLYVAWTRARHRLIIVCFGTELRQEIELILTTPS